MDGFLVSESFVKRVNSAVSRLDGLAQSSPLTNIPTYLEEVRKGVGDDVFRIATFTGSWSLGSDKTVTFKRNTASTANVTNVFASMNPPGSCDCHIAKDGTAWYCVSANLTQQQGYSSSGTQVLSVVNGSLRWIGTTACA